MVFPAYSSDKAAEILGLIHGVAGVSSAKGVIIPFSRAQGAAAELRAFGAEVLIVSEEIGRKVGSKNMGELSSRFDECVR